MKSEEKAEKKSKEKKYKAIEFQVPLLFIRTKRGLKLLDKLGSLKVTPLIGWLHLMALPVMSVIIISFMILSLWVTITSPVLREITRSLGPQAILLIPGLNPLIPVVFGWIAIVVALVVHEVGHGVVARALGIKVKSMGLLLLVILPIGAFVELDDKKMAKASLRNVGRILGAGPGNNLITAIISLLALFLLVSSLVPVTPERGAGITEVIEGLPAESVGLLPGDIIISVNGRPTPSPFELSTVLSSSSAGDSIELSYARGDEIITKNIELAQRDVNSSRGIMGVFLTSEDPIRSLERYNTLSVNTPQFYLTFPTFGVGKTIAPYSETMSVFYTSPLGQAYLPLASLLFWIWFINFFVGIFNALPLYPFDGGQAFKKLVQSIGRVDDKLATRITLLVTLVMIGMLASLISLPYILPRI